MDEPNEWANPTPGPGLMENSLGHFVPAARVRPEHKLEDQLVRDLVARAGALNAELRAFKAAAFGDVREFLTLLAERYKTSAGGARGGVQLHSFDGRMRVSISVADVMTFGPELRAAKSLIDECITAWSEGANEHIRTIVNDAFNVGDGGKLQVDRVLALRRLDIDDPTWKRAMEAIGDALRVVQTREYVRLYTRPTQDAQWTQIVLDMSRV